MEVAVHSPNQAEPFLVNEFLLIGDGVPQPNQAKPLSLALNRDILT
jgi:hypothetical protein